MSSVTEQQARGVVVKTYRRLADARLLELSSGNLSVRLGDHVLITPTGANERLTEDSLVLIDTNGRSLAGGVPSSEWRMHVAIYERREDARGVVHAHPDYCTALACLRKPLPAFHYMVAGFGGDDVPCVDFAPFGSDALGRAAADALEDRTACLLANHGMICHGKSLEAAEITATKLEMLARQYLIALMAGEPGLLSPDDMREARRRYAFYGHARIPD